MDEYTIARNVLDSLLPGTSPPDESVLLRLSDTIPGLTCTWETVLRRHPDWARKGASHGTGPALVRRSAFDSNSAATAAEGSRLDLSPALDDDGDGTLAPIFEGTAATAAVMVLTAPTTHHQNVILLKDAMGCWDRVSLRKCFGKYKQKSSAKAERGATSSFHLHNPQLFSFPNCVFYYPFGNTAPVNVLEWAPKNPAVDVLLLACGDPRSLLWSLHAHRGSATLASALSKPSLVRFTCIDVEPAVLARNLLLLQLLTDTRLLLESDAYPAQLASIFSIFYNGALRSDDLLLLRATATQLHAASGSSELWAAQDPETSLAGVTSFLSTGTLTALHDLWGEYADADGVFEAAWPLDRLRKAMLASTRAHYPLGEAMGKVVRGRMTGGLAMWDHRRMVDLLQPNGATTADAVRYRRDAGMLGVHQAVAGEGSSAVVPPVASNPTLVLTRQPCSGSEFQLHYALYPPCSFPLDCVRLPLVSGSTFAQRQRELFGQNFAARVDEGLRAGILMLDCFCRTWCAAMADTSQRVHVRVLCADALDGADILLRLQHEHTRSSGEGGATVFSGARTKLGRVTVPAAVGAGAAPIVPGDTKPFAFDVIDSSNVADHIGTVNILVAGAALLKHHAPWAVIFTQHMTDTDATRATDSAAFALATACMPMETCAILLGLAPNDLSLPCTSELPMFSPMLMLKPRRIVWRLANGMDTITTAPPLVSITPTNLANMMASIFSHLMTSMTIVSTLRKSNMHTCGTVARLFLAATRQLYITHEHVEACCRALADPRRTGIIVASNFAQCFASLLLAHGGIGMWELAAPPSSPGLARFNLRADPAAAVRIGAHPPVLARVFLVLPRKVAQEVLLKGAGRTTVSTPQLLLGVRSVGIDNRFDVIHCAMGSVRKRRRQDNKWLPLGKHLEILPEAGAGEQTTVVVSAIVPTTLLMQASAACTHLDLYLGQTSAMHMRKLRPQALCNELDNRLFSASLANPQHTVVDLSPLRMAADADVLGVVVHPSGACAPRAAMVAAGCAPSPSPALKASNLRLVVGGGMSGSWESLHCCLTAVGGAERILASTKAPEVVQQSVCTLTVTIRAPGRGGSKCSVRLVFPVPVSVHRCKLQFSRKRGVVDVFARLARSKAANPFPMAWALPRVCLDLLPSINVGSLGRKGLLYRWASAAFSKSDREGRSSVDTMSPLLNLKESLQLLLYSLSGDNPRFPNTSDLAPWVFLRVAGLGKVAMLFVAGIRAQVSSAVAVVDACAYVFEEKVDLSVFVGIAARAEGRVLIINCSPGEMRLWRWLLAASAERARNGWEHSPDCVGSPISLETGHQCLCSCGRGLDLPPAFQKAMVNLDQFERALVQSRFTRVALPAALFPSTVDVRMKGSSRGSVSSMAMKMQSAFAEALARGSSYWDALGDATTSCAAPAKKEIDRGNHKCVKCGKVAKHHCSRCRSASYCSVGCQRADWKQHKRNCKKKADHRE